LGRISASTLPSMVPTQSCSMFTSFRTTGATVTAGGGGAGFSCLEEHPAKLQTSSSDAQRSWEGPRNHLQICLLDIISRFRRSTMAHLDSVVIRFLSGLRRLKGI